MKRALFLEALKQSYANLPAGGAGKICIIGFVEVPSVGIGFISVVDGTQGLEVVVVDVVVDEGYEVVL